MSTEKDNRPDDPQAMFTAIQRRLRRLTVAVTLMALVWAITCATVFGNLVNYFGRDPLMIGSALIGAALLGFGFGWVARRRA